MAAAKKKFKKIKLDLESGHAQQLTVAGDFKIHDLVLDVDSPYSWLVIPLATGGHFCVRSGTVLSMHVEDEASVVG